MKNVVIHGCMNLINKYNNFSDEKQASIIYGLEGIYLTITKTIVILIIAALLNYFWESIIFTITFGLLRSFSYGIHAKKSWMCWISSLTVFILIPVLASKIVLPIYLIISLGIIGTVFIFKNSPADTVKRPIVNKKRRLRLKITATIIALIYVVLCLITNSYFICNCLLFSILLQNILISKLTYKLFKLPYNNYISYLKNHPELNNL